MYTACKKMQRSRFSQTKCAVKQRVSPALRRKLKAAVNTVSEKQKANPIDPLQKHDPLL